MISLRPMREDEFSSYLDSFIREFAVEVASNYGIAESAALEQVKREMASDLPDGIHTTGQVLTCLIDATQTLKGWSAICGTGRIWRRRWPSSWIFRFFLRTRGKASASRP